MNRMRRSYPSTVTAEPSSRAQKISRYGYAEVTPPPHDVGYKPGFDHARERRSRNH